MYIYSWKELIKFWPILVILYVKSIFSFIARDVQLDNGVDPLGRLVEWRCDLAQAYKPHDLFLVVQDNLIALLFLVEQKLCLLG
jgi:hypothetical protein